MENRIYRLADGRLWNTASASWISPVACVSLPDDAQEAFDNGELEYQEIPVIDLVSASGESNEAYLARNLIFYGYPLGELSPQIADCGAEPSTAIAAIKEELANLDAKYLTPRILAGLATGDSYAMSQWREHEQKAAPLRERLGEFANDVPQ